MGIWKGVEGRGGGMQAGQQVSFFISRDKENIWAAKHRQTQMTTWPWVGSFIKPTYEAQPNNLTWSNLLGERGSGEKTGKKGKNEWSQIKPCAYCTLETCCHGGRNARKEVKESDEPSHTESCTYGYSQLYYRENMYLEKSTQQSETFLQLFYP